MTLVLLSGLGTLALASAAAAIAALALAGHQQSAQAAFEAAESGVAHALEFAAVARSEGRAAARALPGYGDAPVNFEYLIVPAARTGPLPAGFSIGEHADSFAAQHYFVISDGRAGRNAGVRIEQGFYLVVPGAGS